MKRSTNRILTTHGGSLPRGERLQGLIRELLAGQTGNQQALAEQIRSSVADVVHQQTEVGIDIPSDGEQEKTGFLLYGGQRLNGFEQVEVHPGDATRANRRDQEAFSEFYEEYFGTEGDGGGRWQPFCTSPISYQGQDAIQSDIENFKAALDGVSAEEAFLPAIAPGTFGRGQNRYYPEEEAFLFATADAMKVEYKAIIDAGFVLQIDNPGLNDTWDMLNPAMSVPDYQKYAAVRIDALNHSLAGLPEEMIRYHICWGSWHGPHTTDFPLKDIIDLILTVKAGASPRRLPTPATPTSGRSGRTSNFPRARF